MGFLTKEIARNSAKRDMVLVDVSELGPAGEKTEVWVRPMTAREKDEWQMSMVSGKGKRRTLDQSDMSAKLAVRVCCNENGELIFGADDWKWLTEKSGKALTQIFDAAAKLNGFAQADEDKEELLKNSGTTPTCDS